MVIGDGTVGCLERYLIILWPPDPAPAGTQRIIRTDIKRIPDLLDVFPVFVAVGVGDPFHNSHFFFRRFVGIVTGGDKEKEQQRREKEFFHFDWFQLWLN